MRKTLAGQVGRENSKRFKPSFMLPRLKDMTGWIVNETKNQNGKIEPRAAEMLKDMVGVDTRQAGMEIAKLLAYQGRPVTGRM
jgi:DNA polymerase III delta subunit